MGPGAVKETHIQNNRILMAMSGGVDSSAAALMLKEQGREVVGVTMLLHDGYDPDDARAVAEKLGIEFHVLDLRREFKETIIDQFVSKYKQGLTPNPCVDCNREIKFGLLWENALKLGCRAMATGHYARIGCRGSEARLLKANYAAKDQSYFFLFLPKELLDHIYFPLGEIEDKEETRKIAAAAGLFTASKSDSQDICFVPDGDYMKKNTISPVIFPGAVITVRKEMVCFWIQKVIYSVITKDTLNIRSVRGAGWAWHQPTAGCMYLIRMLKATQLY